MLDQTEIDLEIAKWEYLESSYENYAKLADLYTIRDHMRQEQTPPDPTALLHAAAPALVEQYGDSDFLQAVSGKDPSQAWEIMDDLMDTLHTVNPRAYDGVMRKIRSI